VGLGLGSGIIALFGLRCHGFQGSTMKEERLDPSGEPTPRENHAFGVNITHPSGPLL
jgi:hypothetical protein